MLNQNGQLDEKARVLFLDIRHVKPLAGDVKSEDLLKLKMRTAQ